MASHLHKTVHELKHAMGTDELCEWMAFFELRNQQGTGSPNPNQPKNPNPTPEQQYASVRNVLN